MNDKQFRISMFLVMTVPAWIVLYIGFIKMPNEVTPLMALVLIWTGICVYLTAPIHNEVW